MITLQIAVIDQMVMVEQLMVAHKRCIPCHQLFLSDSSYELIACQLDIKPKPVILCAVHRASSTDFHGRIVWCSSFISCS